MEGYMNYLFNLDLSSTPYKIALAILFFLGIALVYMCLQLKVSKEKHIKNKKEREKFRLEWKLVLLIFISLVIILFTNGLIKIVAGIVALISVIVLCQLHDPEK